MTYTKEQIIEACHEIEPNVLIFKSKAEGNMSLTGSGYDLLKQTNLYPANYDIKMTGQKFKSKDILLLTKAIKSPFFYYADINAVFHFDEELHLIFTMYGPENFKTYLHGFTRND